MKSRKSVAVIALFILGTLLSASSLATERTADPSNTQVKALPASCGVVTFTQDPKAFKILFIGNSITYWHDVPRIFAWLMFENEPLTPTKIAYVVGNNYKLKDHWDAKLALKFIKNEGPWDYVILQDKSGSEYRTNSSAPYLEAFIQSIKAEKAKPILFETYRDKPDQSADSERLFNNLSTQNQIELLPVGKVWNRIRKDNLDFELYDPAGHHPSLIGSYLVAVIAYVKLRQKIPHVISDKLNYQDRRDRTISLFETQAKANEFNSLINNCLHSLIAKDAALN